MTLIGSVFRPGRLERFGEAFMHRAAPYALTGDVLGLRRVFLEAVHQLSDWLTRAYERVERQVPPT